jgi:hypothetical protein
MLEPLLPPATSCQHAVMRLSMQISYTTLTANQHAECLNPEATPSPVLVLAFIALHTQVRLTIPAQTCSSDTETREARS